MLMVEELVEKYSEGTIDVEVYPASQLGSNVEFSEGVALGEIEAAVCGFDGLGNYAPVANALCMPYLFTSNEDAMAKIYGDTDVHDALDEAFGEINMKIVGYVNRPFRVVCNSVRSVKTPDDMKGLVLRSPTSAVNTAINSAMGADPVTISWGEVYTSMSQGACDAVENAITELKSINLEQQCKYISETNHTGGLIPMFSASPGMTAWLPASRKPSTRPLPRSPHGAKRTWPQRSRPHGRHLRMPALRSCVSRTSTSPLSRRPPPASPLSSSRRATSPRSSTTL